MGKFYILIVVLHLQQSFQLLISLFCPCSFLQLIIKRQAIKPAFDVALYYCHVKLTLVSVDVALTFTGTLGSYLFIRVWLSEYFLIDCISVCSFSFFIHCS